ncbi:MAG: acyl carrier protein [Candidatus Omnitrophota bacterium]|nr:MAG: acyl carrier protein [Candidatus Omnitrophota bacterium]
MGVREDVLGVICNVLDVGEDQVKMEQNLYDCLGVDSTEMVELSVSLAKKFGIKLEQREITNKHTPFQISDIIEKKKNN